jgi:hypothetical protein
MDSPFISWQEWEGHVLDFFHFALEELAKEPNLPHLEADKAADNLNRRLSIVCRKNKLKWELKTECPIFNINFNGRNQPRIEDIQPHESENKEPDFQVDAFRDYERMNYYSYAVECKRLHFNNQGYPHGSSQYYVHDGILRFIRRKFSYGIDTQSGLMIGFVQSGDFNSFLEHINNYCSKASVSTINHPTVWNDKGVSRLEQWLTRTEMEPLQFQLRHFWVDLR